MRMISKGAEADLYLDDGIIRKVRMRKPYRIAEIDERLRKERTRKEAKVIKGLKVPAPRLVSVDEKTSTISMTYIPGDRLRDVLEQRDYVRICRRIGEIVAEMHDSHIMHGDLTTSNIILSGDEAYMIDFGLSYHSLRVEDKAVDLHLLRQALSSKHSAISDACFEAVLDGYGRERPAVSRLAVVESRGRNKH